MRVGYRFFYLRLCDGPQSGQGSGWERLRVSIAGANDLLGLYGVRRFISAIDNNEHFDTSGLIGAILAHIAGEGWTEVFTEHGMENFPTAQSYRQRHITEALRSVFGGG